MDNFALFPSSYPKQFQPTTNLKFVNGRKEADAYVCYPDSQILLMDKDEDRFYLKVTDSAGRSEVSEYSFQHVAEPIDMDGYLTRREFEEWRSKHEQPVQSTEPIQQRPVEIRPTA